MYSFQQEWTTKTATTHTTGCPPTAAWAVTTITTDTIYTTTTETTCTITTGTACTITTGTACTITTATTTLTAAGADSVIITTTTTIFTTPVTTIPFPADMPCRAVHPFYKDEMTGKSIFFSWLEIFVMLQNFFSQIASPLYLLLLLFRSPWNIFYFYIVQFPDLGIRMWERGPKYLFSVFRTQFFTHFEIIVEIIWYCRCTVVKTL